MKRKKYILVTIMITFLAFNSVVNATNCSNLKDKKSCKADSDCKWKKNGKSGYCNTDCSDLGSAGKFFADSNNDYQDCVCGAYDCEDVKTYAKTGNVYGLNVNNACSDGSGKSSVKYKGKEYCYSGNTGVYCSNKSSDCFGVSKKAFVYPNIDDIYVFEVASYGKGEIDLNFKINFLFINIDKKVTLKEKDLGKAKSLLFTTNTDPVALRTGVWWSTLVKCEYQDVEWTGPLSPKVTYDVMFFTDNLEKLEGDDSSHLIKLNKSSCTTYSIKNADSKNKVYYCNKLSEISSEIRSYVNDYKNKSSKNYQNVSLITKYKEKVEEIRGTCQQLNQYSDYNDGCLQHCMFINEDISNWNKSFGIQDESKCGFSSRLINWILNIIKWIKYLVPVAVIVFGILDFIKAIASEKEDEMKKAQGRFVKRLIAAALIFLVPLLVEFVLPKLGFDYNSCGLF